jgi:hypothetical protein
MSLAVDGSESDGEVISSKRDILTDHGTSFADISNQCIDIESIDYAAVDNFNSVAEYEEERYTQMCT